MALELWLYFISVGKELGSWNNDGLCEATGDNALCGPGIQKQTRTCSDGTTDVCTPDDREQTISCTDANTTLPDCIKQIGSWNNDGPCVATGDNALCGPGNQKQARTCSDGTTDVCAPADREQTISCTDANTTLPDCIKQFGSWNNDGPCEATGDNTLCGIGNQKQTRTCSDGTTDVCMPADREQTIYCHYCPGKVQ